MLVSVNEQHVELLEQLLIFSKLCVSSSKKFHAYARPHLLQYRMSLINGDIPVYRNQYMMEGIDFAASFIRREVDDEP